MLESLVPIALFLKLILIMIFQQNIFVLLLIKSCITWRIFNLYFHFQLTATVTKTNNIGTYKYNFNEIADFFHIHDITIFCKLN